MGHYPKEIEAFQQSLNTLQGIENVCSGIDNLEGISNEELQSPDYAHLPIGALRRTQGGLKDEVMLQFEFSLDGSKEALISLEFLSWFIRDQARSGKLIQLRTFALPPMTPKGLQLGQTLKFHIDYFVENAPDSLAPILEEIASIDHVLQTLISLYEIPCKMNALDTK